MIEINLTDVSHCLQALLNRVRSNAYEDFEAFFEEATLAFHEFPYYIRKVINTFVRGGDADGVLLVRNFPVDSALPPTPLGPNENIDKAAQMSEFWLCCIASMLGEPVAYLQERGGRIFQDLYPTRANEDKLSSDSSSVVLGFHTEMAFHPFLPDYLLLYCLRQDPEKEAITSFSSVSRVIEKLTDQQKTILLRPLFKTGIDYSFGSENGTKGNGPAIAVLYGNLQQPYLRFDHDLMTGVTKEAQSILEELREIIHLVREDIIMEPDSMLVLANRRCVHARSTFTAHYDGKDRWLQRMLVTRDIAASFPDRVDDGRVIATNFSQFLTSSL